MSGVVLACLMVWFGGDTLDHQQLSGRLKDLEAS